MILSWLKKILQLSKSYKATEEKYFHEYGNEKAEMMNLIRENI